MMEHRPDQPAHSDRIDAPHPLARDLQGLFGGATVMDAPQVDAAIGRAIRARASAGRRAKLIRWSMLSVSAAAAAITLVVLLPMNTPTSPQLPGVSPMATAADPRDIDGNARIDILDAFAIARAAASHTAPLAWDQNGDGVVDRRDADVIAQTAVSLLDKGVSG